MRGTRALGARRILDTVWPKPLAVAARAGNEMATLREATQPVGNKGPGAPAPSLARLDPVWLLGRLRHRWWEDTR